MKTSRTRTRSIAIALVGLVFLLLVPGKVTSQEDKFLNRLQGTWQGDGKAFGRAARLHIKWEWVLDKKFLRLSLKNEMNTPNGENQVFEGQAYYRAIGRDKYEAQWFDSRGLTFPIKAHLDGDSLIALWGSPDKEEGKPVYKIDEAGTLEVVDSVKQKDGTWSELGRVLLKRA
jgi:hypothetical protein